MLFRSIESDFDAVAESADDVACNTDSVAKEPVKRKLKDVLSKIRRNKIPTTGWWENIEDEEVSSKSYKRRKPKKNSRLDRVLKFRKLTLRIKPVVGKGSRQALWDCPITKFPDSLISPALKDFMAIHDLNTIRNLTVLTKKDVFNKLSKYFDSETCKAAIKEITKAFKAAGLNFFYSANKDDSLDNV